MWFCMAWARGLVWKEEAIETEDSYFLWQNLWSLIITEAGGLRHLCPLAAHPWWLQWKGSRKEKRVQGFLWAQFLFLALPQSWIAGASRVPPYRVQGAERAGGQRGCVGVLTTFPRNRSCKRESKDQPGVWIWWFIITNNHQSQVKFPSPAQISLSVLFPFSFASPISPSHLGLSYQHKYAPGCFIKRIKISLDPA